MNLKKDSIFANRYTLVKRLGKGGFSEVWLASDKLSSIDVALKIGDDSQEFCNELEMVHNLSHPNLLIPRHLDIWNGKPYLVMEYCSQGSCYGRIKQMSESQLWDLLADVASGLKCLHDHDVLHQDIKPDNILIDGAGNYIITDFGISTKSRKTVKIDAGVAGSRAYMAAERKSMSVRASDIWAFGATMFEIIDGETPFGDLGGLAQEANEGNIPELTNPSVSAELKATVYAMLSLLAWNRPSAEQLLEIAENHSKIWQIAKDNGNHGNPVPAAVNQVPKAGQEKKTNPISKGNGSHVAQTTESSTSKKLIAALIVVVVLCGAALSYAVYNKLHHAESQLLANHQEVIERIDSRGYKTFDDFKAHYRDLEFLYKIEHSEGYKGEKMFNDASKKLNREVNRSWNKFSSEEKKELSQLSERLNK